jgi:hypothetical protein
MDDMCMSDGCDGTMSICGPASTKDLQAISTEHLI